MKTVCIYHSIDLDGWMSAAIVKYIFKEINNDSKELNKLEVDFIGYNYGQEIPNLENYDKIIMCDISFPLSEFQKLRQGLLKDIIWIDHHASAIKESDEYANNFGIKGIRDSKFSACELTWKFFFNNLPMPEIVRLLGRYDCFGHKGTDEEQKVLEFQYGARSVISNYQTAYLALQESIRSNDKSVENIHSLGIAIYSFLCTDAKQSYKNGFEIFFRLENSPLYKFICINKERFNPMNFGIDYHKEGYDGCACFHYANGEWNFSLYNDNGNVDCSLIAKSFGGGGHKGASGFIVKDIGSIIYNKI